MTDEELRSINAALAAKDAEIAALKARVAELEAALDGVTPSHRAYGCWCEISRDIERHGHSEACRAAARARGGKQ